MFNFSADNKKTLCVWRLIPLTCGDVSPNSGQADITHIMPTLKFCIKPIRVFFQDSGLCILVRLIIFCTQEVIYCIVSCHSFLTSFKKYFPPLRHLLLQLTCDICLCRVFCQFLVRSLYHCYLGPASSGLPLAGVRPRFSGSPPGR